MAENSSTAGSGRDARITIYPDGPMLVRGEVDIVAADGSPLPQRRRTVALCRCGHSGLMPLCDGTHKVVWKPGRDNALSRRRTAAEDD